MPLSTENISAVVGSIGPNRPTDVAWIQAYLNMVPPALGGPVTKLKQDGKFGPKTKAVILDQYSRPDIHSHLEEIAA